MTPLPLSIVIVALSLSLIYTEYSPTLVDAACPPVKRSTALLRQFRRTHPCPSTGLTTGACPTHVIDHQLPLCLTGPSGDMLANLAWQDVPSAKAKDTLERTLCRRYCACPH